MNRIRWLSIDRLPVLAAAGTMLLAGCSTPSGYKQADRTGEGIASMRAEVVNGQRAIDETVLALEQVAATANTNPRKAFGHYSKCVVNLDATAARIRKRSDEMKARGQTYFQQWEQELTQVRNPEIRELAEQQRTNLLASFDTIQQYAESFRAQFDPWLSDLKDLRTYLNNDLSTNGVAAAQGLFSKTRDAGTEVQKTMNALVAELNTVASALTPAKVEVKK
jgi:hypothetical protein